MTRWWLAALGGIASLLVAAGHAGGAGAPATVKADGLAISLATTPDPPARQEATAFEIIIRDAAGQPVSGARVTLDLGMTGMAMEDSRPRVQERGGGRYAAAAAFSMGGEWRATVEVILPDGRRTRAEFPVRVR